MNAFKAFSVVCLYFLFFLGGPVNADHHDNEIFWQEEIVLSTIEEYNPTHIRIIRYRTYYYSGGERFKSDYKLKVEWHDDCQSIRAGGINFYTGGFYKSDEIVGWSSLFDKRIPPGNHKVSDTLVTYNQVDLLQLVWLKNDVAIRPYPEYRLRGLTPEYLKRNNPASSTRLKRIYEPWESYFDRVRYRGAC